MLAFDLRSCSALGDFQNGSESTHSSHTNFRREISEWHRNAHSVVFIEKGCMSYFPYPKVESERYSNLKLPVVDSITASEDVHIRMPTLCCLRPRKKEEEFCALLGTSGSKCCPHGSRVFRQAPVRRKPQWVVTDRRCAAEGRGRGTEECRKDKLVILQRASMRNDKTSVLGFRAYRTIAESICSASHSVCGTIQISN